MAYLWLLVSLAVCACVAGADNNKDGPKTRTPLGTIRGSWMETRRGRRFHAYRGVRYAQPPIGPLRFEPPKPIVRYTSVVDASQEGPACPLIAPPDYYVDEDCLRLNVYTPDNNKDNLYPVIFFIHPGGFYSMTGRSDVIGPHYLLDRDVVLVTINYRLSTLGFLSTGDKYAPGNNGMKDMVAALRWVKKNILSFGGDPDNITVAGVSAGSISALLMMVSPMSKGLFHRAISISGSPTGKVPTRRHQNDLAIKQAQLVNCPTNSSKEMIECFRTKDWRELSNYVQFFEIGFDPVSLWDPVVERDFGQERFLDKDPVQAIKDGKFIAVPHIISQTTDEFSWFARNVLRNETLVKRFNEEWDRLAPISFVLPKDDKAVSNAQTLKQVYLGGKPLANDAASIKGMGDLYVDSIEGFPVNRMVNLMAKYSPKPVYYYILKYFGNHSYYEDPETNKPIAAMHHDDMIYLFTLSYMFPAIALDTPDNDIVERMTAIWYNFARFGNPNPREDTPELGELCWPPVKPDARKYLLIDNELTIHSNYNEDRYKIWEELYPLKPWPLPA